MADHLSGRGGWRKTSLAREDTDEDRGSVVHGARCAASCGDAMSEADAQAYEIAGRFDLSWRGLARYWRKRENRSTRMAN